MVNMRFCALVFLWAAGACAFLHAQPASTQPASAPGDAVGFLAADVQAADIEARIHQLEAASTDDSVTTQIIDLYRSALGQLQRADSLAAEVARFEQLRRQAPREVEHIRERLAQLKSAPSSQATPEVPAEATLDQVAERLSEAETDLATRQDAARKLEEEADRRVRRKAWIPEDLLRANVALEGARRELTLGPGIGVNQEVARARTIALMAQQKSLERQILSLKEELRCYQATDDLLAVQREETAIGLANAETAVAELRARLSRLRLQEADRRKLEASRQLRDAPEAIRRLVMRTSELAGESIGLVEQIDQLVSQTRRADRAIETQSDNLKALRNAIEVAGSGTYIGALLNRHGRQLPDPVAIEREIRRIDRQTTVVQLRLTQLEEERDGLVDVEARTAEFLELLRQTGMSIDEGQATMKIRRALQMNLESIDGLRRDYAQYWDRLIAAKTTQNRLVAVTEAYGRFIEEHALWFPSKPPFYRASFPRQLTPKPGTWSSLADGIRSEFARYNTACLAAIVILAAWIGSRGLLNSRLRAIQERVKHPYSDSFAATIEALVLELLVVLPGPTALWLCSRLVYNLPAEDGAILQFAHAISTGLFSAGLQWAVLSFFRQVSRPGGIGEVHFQWPAPIAKRMHVTLTWLLVLVVPLAFVVNFSVRHPDDDWAGSVGRVGLFTALVICAVFFRRLLHPKRGMVAEFDAGSLRRGMRNLLFFLYLMLLAVLLALGCALLMGYENLAQGAIRPLARTIWLGLGLLVLRSLLLRFVLVSQRRLAVRNAQERRQGGPAAGEDGVPVPASPAESGFTALQTVGNDTRTLLRWVLGCVFVVGMWSIWREFVPAFSFINRVELWSYTSQIAAAAEDGAGGGQPLESAAGVQTVTLADLIYAVLAAVITSVLAVHGPKVLAITFLSRFRLDAGARFAVASLSRYVVILLGLIVSLQAIGVGWSKVQWMAAAITVGLGFGLQEIFANFVSGLIILFERPVRLGDVVSVGGVDGKITRIRMRAVTITDWNRRELIVPNKEFITGQIINWTLSDPVTRVDVPVGIAYGSDTRTARDLLLQVARQCPYILKDPPPTAIFKGFGESSLDFELRVHIPNRDVWPDTVHELHTRIDDEFRKASIEIAFPQRDIHVRSVTDRLPAVGAGLPPASDGRLALRTADTAGLAAESMKGKGE